MSLFLVTYRVGSDSYSAPLRANTPKQLLARVRENEGLRGMNGKKAVEIKYEDNKAIWRKDGGWIKNASYYKAFGDRA